MAILVGCFIISSKLFGLLMMVTAIIGFNEFFKLRYSMRNKRIDIVRILGWISLSLIVLNNVFYKADISILIIFPMLFLMIVNYIVLEMLYL